jgi:hypothetical protein
MRMSRKLREAAVSFTRTWLDPGVGTSLSFFRRSETLEAFEGMVQAVFVAGVDIVRGLE